MSAPLADFVFELAGEAPAGARTPRVERICDAVESSPRALTSDRAPPNRTRVVSAMCRIGLTISACGEGAHGTLHFWLDIDGHEGAVRRVVVSADDTQPFSASVYECAALVACGARVGAFSGARLTVVYPFRL